MNINSLSLYFRLCAFCSAYSKTIDLYCPSCWRELNSLKLPPSVRSLNNYDFELTCLWNWNNKNSELLKNLIYSLKQGGLEDAYFKIASELAYKFHKSSPSYVDKYSYLIPAPARDPKRLKMDHAYQLASALSQCSGIKLLPILERKNTFSQKRRSREHRQSIQFEKTSALPQDCTRVIFVDDLVTTGSTASAAHAALGENIPFCCLSVAEKKLEKFLTTDS